MQFKVIILIIAGMLITTGFLLSFGPVSDQINGDTSSDNNSNTDVPGWQKAEYWSYSVNSMYNEPAEIDMVVYDNSNGNYFVGTDSRDHALVHSVYNINPMLGRMTVDNLDVYENGEPKSLYQFPLTDGASWQNTLHEKSYDVEASTSGDGEFSIIAVAEDGSILAYDYDPAVNWFTYFTIIDRNGNDIFSLELIEHGYDYKGTVYFMRATDLYSSSSLATDNGEFTVSGHSKYGDFDHIAVGIKSTQNYRMINTVLTSPSDRHYRIGSGNFEITEIQAENGDWTASVYSMPNMFAFVPPLVEVQISGVIEYSAEL
jgi:hypothetical protein